MSYSSIPMLKELEIKIANQLPSKSRHTIVLNPDNRIQGLKVGDGVVYDKASWNFPDGLEEYVDKLSDNNELSTEEKILKLYEHVCTEYVYDDNLISYIKKADDDSFALPDWYGRDVDENWENNRKQHNRRVCFELARYLASGLTKLSEDTNDYSVAIYWNKGLTHYLVGLTNDDYSIAMDPDDFFNIKDLTRLKTGLTAQGIVVLEDKNHTFTEALNEFNKDRENYATVAISDEINQSRAEKQEEPQDKEAENEDVAFFRKAMDILVNKRHLDSQGIFEYMKELADIKLGRENREKIYRNLPSDTPESSRYIRCLIAKIADKEYLIDGHDGVFREFDREEFTQKRPLYAPCKTVTRTDFDYYDGR